MCNFHKGRGSKALFLIISYILSFANNERVRSQRNERDKSLVGVGMAAGTEKAAFLKRRLYKNFL